NSETNRSDDSAECAGESGQSDSLRKTLETIGLRRVMKKEIFTLLLSIMLFALRLPVEAQQPKKTYRIGYLSGTDRETDARRAELLRRALREIGYIEGQNIVIESRHAENKSNLQSKNTDELVHLKVDLIIVAGGGDNIRTAMNVTKTIPIV